MKLKTLATLALAALSLNTQAATLEKYVVTVTDSNDRGATLVVELELFGVTVVERAFYDMNKAATPQGDLSRARYTVTEAEPLYNLGSLKRTVDDNDQTARGKEASFSLAEINRLKKAANGRWNHARIRVKVRKIRESWFDAEILEKWILVSDFTKQGVEYDLYNDDGVGVSLTAKMEYKAEAKAGE